MATHPELNSMACRVSLLFFYVHSANYNIFYRPLCQVKGTNLLEKLPLLRPGQDRTDFCPLSGRYIS